MVPAVFSNPKTKKLSKVLVVITLAFSSLIIANETKACAAALSESGLESEWNSAMGGMDISAVYAADKAKQAANITDACKLLLGVAAKIPCITIPGTDIDCTARDSCFENAQAECQRSAANAGATLNAEKLVRNAKLRDTLRETLAMAFKSSLKQFARQVSHDTAVWVASGGRGQKPLFITEGWGAYLKNTADAALGQFIDGIGSVYGADLCQPDFRVKLLIQTSLNYKKTKTTRCTFTKIMKNWNSAIANADFSIEYRNAMRPGENDISFMLMMADQRNSYVSESVTAATKAAETTGLWSDIKNIAGKILTPGTLIANKLRSDTETSQTSIGFSTFTNTAADIVEEFANTLVSQLLNNLQSGFFSSSGSGGGTGKSGTGDLLPSPDTLASLFNVNSSPLVAGVAGAKEKFLGLILNREKVGNRYDILVKLANCPDSAKTSPDVTDCVLDNTLSEQIRKKVYVKDLPADIKNRAFAPSISETNSLETEIPYRSVLILRKYRIVPVGWEMAANKIKLNTIKDTNGAPLTKKWTLGDLMNCFYGHNAVCETDDFKNLVDPNWLLKIYEAYCRREGFGAHDSGSNDQSTSVARDEYCADEQQCLADDEKGNCKSYGYCSEERKLWNLGSSCEAVYNTCQTYKSRAGSSQSVLKNSLDFSNCSSLNVGCRSYTDGFDAISNVWNGEFVDRNNILKTYQSNFTGGQISVGSGEDWRVPEYHSVSNNYLLKVSLPCSSDLCSGTEANCTYNSAKKYCDFNQPDNRCSVLPGGVSCMVESCYEDTNLIASQNSGFDIAESGGQWNALSWTDELSYLDSNNRHYRDVLVKRNGNASLHLLSSKNSAALITKLGNVTLAEKDVNYVLKFWAKGSITSGQISINVGYDSEGEDSVMNSAYLVTKPDWTEYSISFPSTGHANNTIKIITLAGTISDVYLDDFSIQKMTDSCQKNGNIRLFNRVIEAPNKRNSTSIYLDRDASTCSWADDGCSSFLRNKANIGGNMVYNGGFEDGLSGWEDRGKDAIGGVNDYGLQNDRINSTGGATFTAVATNDMRAYRRIDNIDGNQYYAISFDAAQTSSTNAYLAKLMMAFYADPIADPNAAGLQIIDTNCITGGDNNTVSLANQPSGIAYSRASCWFKAPIGANFMVFRLVPAGDASAEIDIDNIKLEKVSVNSLTASNYTSYSPNARPANQISYLKKAPDYFNCYRNAGGKWPETEFELTQVLQNRHEMCANYSGVCTKKEVGCELYAPDNGDPAVPGIVDNLDLCPSECAGYQVYKQENTFFAAASFKQFIADKKVKYCSAAYAGCDEFTNLDRVGQGAENKEYYVQFKACQKPAVDDAAYYTWEGSDTTGYQLKSYALKKSNRLTTYSATDGYTPPSSYAPCTNLKYQPCIDANDDNVCDNSDAGRNYCDDMADTGATNLDWGICTKDDMASNSDCREFYDVDGNISYRLLSKTITVSDDCHPYRRTQTQLTSEQTKADCEYSHGYFNANSECIYMAIPGEGKVCTAQVKGCRSYTGNKGNNVKKIIGTAAFDEDATQLDWVGPDDGSKTGLIISSESTYPGGRSLSNNLSNQIIRRKVSLTKNKTYILSFWAKGDISYHLDAIKFTTAPSAADYFTDSKVVGDVLLNSNPLIANEWRYYELGPVFVSWNPNADNEYLVFDLPGDRRIYLDNVILKEITNNVYAIENSWYTPISCDNRMDDPDGKKSIEANTCQDQSSGRCSVGEMIGCQAYKDRFNNPWYLRSFSSLCRTDAVGCEALIDTHNSNSPFEQQFNIGVDIDNPGADNDYDTDAVTVPADETVYMVNDSKYACQSSAKGCQVLGLPSIDRWDDVVGYSSVALKNDPDAYDTIMCKHNELWCEQYSTVDSLSYFKNPHGKACQYGKPSLDDPIGWYISGTNLPCVSTLDQTWGTGYEPNRKKLQPIGPVNNMLDTANNDYRGWVGSCPEEKSGCSEYIDPLTFVYANQILQGSCSSAPATGAHCDNIKLKTKTLYSYQLGSGFLSFEKVDCGVGDVTFVNANDSSLPILGGQYFFINDDSREECVFNIKRVDASNQPLDVPFDFNDDIRQTSQSDTKLGDRITKAGVYYALKQSVNKSECSGMVDFNNNCVLFNERDDINYSVVPPLGNGEKTRARSYNYLNYNAQETFNNNMTLLSEQKAVGPSVVSGGRYGNANVILKVKPDRTCNNWLMCTTFEKGKTNDPSLYFSVNDRCLQFKACDYLDENGQCGNFIDHDPNQVVASSEAVYYAGASGYAGDNLRYFDAMGQWGENGGVVNGNFENGFNGTAEPIGWKRAYYICDKVNSCGLGRPVVTGDRWLANYYSISNEGGTAKEGSNFLKLNADNAAVSELIEVNNGQPYSLTVWANTKNLNGPGNGNNRARAEVQLRFIDSQTNQPIIGSGKIGLIYHNDNNISERPVTLSSRDGWFTDYHLQLDSGKDWTQLQVGIEIINSDNPVNLEISLINLNPDDSKEIDNTKLGGYSAWDNIEIKPVLNVNNNKFVNRSCRIFPTSGAPACSYASNLNSYYGQYGYCLLDDPTNPQQCLQWWPVDTIKGETLSDYNSSYKERYPLYYCLEKQGVSVDFGELAGSFGVFGQGADKSGFSNWKLDRNGKEVTIHPFNIPSAWAPLFRFPFVYRLNFIGGIVVIGSTASHKIGGTNLNATMYRDMVCVGVFDVLNSLSNVLGTPNIGCFAKENTTIASEHQQSNDTQNINRACTDNSNAKGETCQEEGDCSGKKYNTSICGRGEDSAVIQDPCAHLDKLECKDVRSWLERIFSGVVGGVTQIFSWIGDLLSGLVRLITGTSWEEWGFNDSDTWGGWGAVTLPMSVPIFGGIEYTPWIGMPYHVAAKLKSSVLMSTINSLVPFIKASTFGMKVITDEDTDLSSQITDIHPDQKGDILGYGFFWDTLAASGVGDKTGFGTLIGSLNGKAVIQYCTKVVQVVTSGGQNKAWSARLTSGSSYRTQDSDCIFDSELKAEEARGNYFNVDRCFYNSFYCTNRKLFNTTGSRNLCDNYLPPVDGIIEDPARGDRQLVCVSNNDNYVWSQSKSDSNDKEKNYDYFCNEGRMYSKTYGNTNYNYLADYKPYGSIVAPATSQYPTAWDSRSDSPGNQPIFYELLAGGSAPYQARMGQVHTVDNLKQLFAKAYGYWEWNNSLSKWNSSGYYKDKTLGASSIIWSLPPDCTKTDPKGNVIRQAGEYCRLKPIFTSNPIVAPENINGIGSTKLSFTIKIDENQLPLKSFTVDWKDGDQTSYAGVSLLSRPNEDDPLTLYHSYSYYNLIKYLSSKPCNNEADTNCCGGARGVDARGNKLCKISPSIEVMDNWNASNSASTVTNILVKMPTQ